jgi:hypothetical protein
VDVPVRTRWIIAVVFVLLGIAWIAQGTGLLRGSGFMDGDMRWALFGAILAVGGVVVGWTAFRMRRV